MQRQFFKKKKNKYCEKALHAFATNASAAALVLLLDNRSVKIRQNNFAGIKKSCFFAFKISRFNRSPH